MLREGRELIPTAKAFQLMTLLRGLGVEELSKPELTGEWEYKLAQMEHGKLSRDQFMHEIADMTKRIVMKAKEYDRDTVPGDYATLKTPCPNCGGVVQESYRRYNCVGKPGQEPCGFSFTKIPAGRAFELRGGRDLPARQAHRPAAGLPLQGRAGRSPPNWRWSSTRKKRTGSWSSTSARTRTPRRPARSSTSRRRSRWAPARSAATGCSSGAATTCASAPCRRRTHPDADLRLPQRQDHPAAAGGARADGQAAGHRQDRPAGQVRLHAHAPLLQGLPDVGRGSRQGELRVRAARVEVPAAQDGGRGDQDHAPPRQGQGAAGAVQGHGQGGEDGGGEEGGAGEEGRRRRRPPSPRRRARPAPA